MDTLIYARAKSPLAVDPRSLMNDPHARFAALRAEHPVILLGGRHYMALRAEDVIALLADPRTMQIEGPDYAQLNQIPDGATASFLGDFFLFGNGEAHRAKRGPFARAFAHSAIRQARGRIRTTAEAIAAELPRGESFDFVERMAARVPAEMIASMLGLPRCEVPYFTARVYEVSRAVGPSYPHAAHAAIESATADLVSYIEAHLRTRLKFPRDDLLTALVHGWQADPVIPFQSLVHQVLGVVVGGSDTTRAAFAMLVALLLRRPEDWAAVKADPALIPGAVSEGLRFEPSVGSIARFTTEPIQIDGVTVPARVMLRVSTMSAMRDPALYAAPDRFDIRRADHPRLHLVFGMGPHRCLGEMLARTEMEEALAALVAAAPGIELETPPRMLGFGGIRQITPMQVHIR